MKRKGLPKKNKSHRSIRTKLLVWFLIVALGPLVIISTVISNLFANELIKNQQEAYSELVFSRAQATDQWLERYKTQIKTIADSRMFLSLDAEAQSDYFQTMKENSPEYAAIFLINEKGITLSHSDRENIGTDYSDRDYFKSIHEEGDIHFSNIVISRTTGKPAIVVATPIKDGNGKLTGGLVASVDVSVLFEQTANDLNMESLNGYPIVVDEQGIIRVHPNEEIVGLTVEESNLEQDLKSILLGEIDGKGYTSYSDNGVNHLVAYSKVNETGYGLFLNIPESSVLQSTTYVRALSWICLFVAAIVVIIVTYFVARSISKPIVNIATQVKKVVDGDLTVEPLKIHNKDEVGNLAQGFNEMTDSLKGLIRELSRSTVNIVQTYKKLDAEAEETTVAANQISSSISEVAGSASEQLQGIQEAAEAMEQIATGVGVIAASSTSVTEAAMNGEEQVKKGHEVIKRFGEQMSSISETSNQSTALIHHLSERSEKIGGIVDIIADIANQTSLLALNASIEAARAGENGLGFAVVAEEVKKLAEQSKASSDEIAALINEIQRATSQVTHSMKETVTQIDEGNELMNDVGEVFEHILKIVRNVAEQIQEVSATSEEISAGTEEITATMDTMVGISNSFTEKSEQVESASEQQKKAMDGILSSSEELNQTIKELESWIKKFKL